MRLVDIFFKNIEGQLSEAKGNLNIIGHLMILSVNDINYSSGISGYFEIDGSTVKDAKTNYNKLWSSLRNTPKSLVNSSGDDIVLSLDSGFMKNRGQVRDNPGSFTSGKSEQHDHEYHFAFTEGQKVRTPKATTRGIEPYFNMRFFIYHGVH